MDREPIISDKCHVCALNCEGVDRSMAYLNSVLDNSVCDILCLQETWVIDQTLNKLGNIHNDFLYTGISGIDASADILVGRPKGGVAILYRKSMAKYITPIDSHSR